MKKYFSIIIFFLIIPFILADAVPGKTYENLNNEMQNLSESVKTIETESKIKNMSKTIERNKHKLNLETQDYLKKARKERKKFIIKLKMTKNHDSVEDKIENFNILEVNEFVDNGNNFGVGESACKEGINPAMKLTSSDNRPGSESGKNLDVRLQK